MFFEVLFLIAGFNLKCVMYEVKMVNETVMAVSELVKKLNKSE